jgi:hypothetical protein
LWQLFTGCDAAFCPISAVLLEIERTTTSFSRPYHWSPATELWLTATSFGSHQGSHGLSQYFNARYAMFMTSRA